MEKEAREQDQKQEEEGSRPHTPDSDDSDDSFHTTSGEDPADHMAGCEYYPSSFD